MHMDYVEENKYFFFFYTFNDSWFPVVAFAPDYHCSRVQLFLFFKVIFILKYIKIIFFLFF